MNAIRQIYDRLIVEGKAQQNPCDSVRLPSGLKTEKRKLPELPDLDVVKTNVDKPFGLFPFLIMYSGLRRGEALALCWEDIDFDADVIRVTKSLFWDNGNTPTIKETKTEAGMRSVPLLPPLREKLLPLRQKSGYVFGLLSQTMYRHRWNGYVKATGVKFSPHQLRHYFVTICFDAGLAEKDT